MVAPAWADALARDPLGRVRARWVNMGSLVGEPVGLVMDIGQPVPQGSRTFGAFLLAIRAAPGFWLRLLMLASFVLSLAVAKGVRTAIEALLLGVLVVVVVGYPLFRRRGSVP